MPLFLGKHKLEPGMKDSDVIEGFNKYKKSAEDSGIHALSAVYSTDRGFAYCQTEADSADQVRKAHETSSIPLEDVIEIKQL